MKKLIISFSLACALGTAAQAMEKQPEHPKQESKAQNPAVKVAAATLNLQAIMAKSITLQSKEVNDANRQEFETVIGQLNRLSTMPSVKAFCEKNAKALQAKLDAKKA
jgi:hypothetical protein